MRKPSSVKKGLLHWFKQQHNTLISCRDLCGNILRLIYFYNGVQGRPFPRALVKCELMGVSDTLLLIILVLQSNNKRTL